MTKIKTYKYDPADFLKTEEDFALYLQECMELDEGDGKMVREAMNVIIRARGLIKTSKSADMTYQGLAKAFSPEGNPELSTFLKALHSVGLKLSVHPA